MRKSNVVRLGMASVALLAMTWTAGAGQAASGVCAAAPAVNVPDAAHSTVPLRGCDTAPGHSSGVDRVGRNRNITKKTGAQSETSIAVDPTNPLHMYAASNDLANFSTYNGIYESFDRGLTWASAGLTVNTFCYDPWLDFNAAGDIFFSYECSDQRIAYKLHGTSTWVQSGSLPAGSFPDRDQVVTDDNVGSPHFGAVYIGYDDNGNSNRAHIMISANGQGGWTESPGIDDTVTTVDVIGNNVAVGNNGDVYATWENFASKKIQNDVSHNGGATWGADRTVTNFRIDTTTFFISIPPQPNRGVLPMPMTDVAPIGTTFAGRLYVAYFDKDPSTADTNIYLRYSNDGGATWSAEKKVNDDSVHAWQFFPAISVSPNGTVALSFYDTRNDPNGKKTDQYISFSTDGGATWSANQRVTKVQSDESGAGDPNDYGDYEGGDASSTNFFQAVWTDSRPTATNEDMFTASAKL
ncbi:MAG: exo-alpha-sialidase [Actinobacteria bacterium]|nr:MAG: exo-alpha-sialidase [Actinomycetota bacterium]